MEWLNYGEHGIPFDQELSYKPLRKGVADLHRRARVSQRSNERYLDALAVVDDTTPWPTTKADERRLSGKVSRRLRLLRAHGIIRKVPRTHRYQATERGRLLTAALRATRGEHQATARRLTRKVRAPLQDFTN